MGSTLRGVHIHVKNSTITQIVRNRLAQRSPGKLGAFTRALTTCVDAFAGTYLVECAGKKMLRPSFENMHFFKGNVFSFFVFVV